MRNSPIHCNGYLRPTDSNEKQRRIHNDDEYPKVTTQISVTNTTAKHVLSASLDHWIIPYDVPHHLGTDNGPQFVSWFFATLSGFYALKHLKEAAYYPHTRGKVERYEKTTVARLR